MKKCTKCGGSGQFHPDKRAKDGLHSWCKKCVNENNRARYYENKEAHKANVARWQAENPEKVAEYNRKRLRDNLHRHNARGREWAKNNPDKKRKSSKKWAQNNRDKIRSYNAKRRAQKANGGGSYTDFEWRRLVKHQDGRCLACGKKKRLTADHVIPISKGGSSNIENIQGLCTSCNSRKGNKTIDYRRGNRLTRWIQRRLL